MSIRNLINNTKTQACQEAVDNGFEQFIDDLAADSGLENVYAVIDDHDFKFDDELPGYILTLDAVSRQVFQKAHVKPREDLYDHENGVDIFITRDSDGKKIYARHCALTAVSKEQGPDVRRLNRWDKSVFCGVCTLLMQGVRTFTPKMVLECMAGKKTKDRTDSQTVLDVDESLRYMGDTNLSFSWADILRANGYELSENEVYRQTAPVLSIRSVNGILGNGVSAAMYKIDAVPELLKLTFVLGHVTTVQSECLEIGSHRTERGLILRDYLIERVMQWNNDNNKKAKSKICLKTIYDECIPENPSEKQKKTIRLQVFSILDEFIENGMISGYKKEKGGRNGKITAVILS